jgi:DNA-binding SARP family transcriptional activator/Tfp pilus assembly protein PilF
LKLAVLGGFSLRGGDGADIALPTRKDRLLLAYLALHAGEALPRTRLCGLLWADRGEAQARGSLRQSIAAVREACRTGGIDPIESTRETVTFVASGVDIDAVAFASLGASPATAAEAAALYRGPLLAEIDPPSPEFAQWLDPERQHLEDLAAQVVERLAEAAASPQAAAAGLDLGRQLLARDPLREPLSRAMMRIMARQGERAAALQLFASCRRALKEDLGIDPDIATEQLYRDILTERPAEPTADPPAAASPPADSRPSLAVMPFDNLSGDPARDSLCEGLTEDVITGLGRFKLLFVIDRHSSLEVAKLTSDASEFARRLGVGLLVQGSLQRQAEGSRITVRLVNPASRSQVWAGTYACDGADILSVPDQVTSAIVATLHARVESSLIEQSRRKPTLAAYEYVLRGIKHLRGYEPDDNREAIKLFEKAMELDPDYALARAYRSLAEVVEHGYDAAPIDILNRARAMAQEAVAMDPDEGRCHWVLGIIESYKGGRATAIQHFVRALSFNPSDANALATYGFALAASGRADEGIERIRAAMRINPYHPQWYWIVLGDGFFVARRFEDAIEAYKQKTSPRVFVLSRLAAALGHLGREEDAKAIVSEILRREPDFSAATRRGIAWTESDTALFRDGMRRAGLPP